MNVPLSAGLIVRYFLLILRCFTFGNFKYTYVFDIYYDSVKILINSISMPSSLAIESSRKDAHQLPVCRRRIASWTVTPSR